MEVCGQVHTVAPLPLGKDVMVTMGWDVGCGSKDKTPCFCQELSSSHSVQNIVLSIN
jgi:hypothetical protein